MLLTPDKMASEGLDEVTASISRKRYSDRTMFPPSVAPKQIQYAVQHVQHHPVFDPKRDTLAFTRVEQFGEKALCGVEYQHFKGTYMGLKKYGEESENDEDLPFPMDADLNAVMVFLYARIFDDVLLCEGKLMHPVPDDENGHHSKLTSDCE